MGLRWDRISHIGEEGCEEPMKKLIRTASISIFALTLLLAIGGDSPLAADFPVKVTDDRCKEITIAKRPEGIVTLLPLYAEILIDLGAVERIVGVADSPDNPPVVEKLPKVGPAFNPNRELIVALKPDVVFGATDFNKLREALEAAKLIVITAGCFRGVPDFGAIKGITDVFKAIRTVGLAVEGSTAKADTLIGQLSEEIIAIEGAVLDRPKPIAAVLYPDPAGKAPPFAAGRGTPEHELLTRAGGLNAFAKLEGYPQVSFEELVKIDPEFIFTDPSQIKLITGDQRLQGLRAVKEKKVCGMKASQWTSSRLAKSLRAIAEMLHPQAFGKEPKPCV